MKEFESLVEYYVKILKGKTIEEILNHQFAERMTLLHKRVLFKLFDEAKK